jgi:energy-coupling factor transporter ATP-binding protein EcfA2
VKVKSIRLQNFRSFVDSGEIELEKINVLIGANNSGKSSILRGLNLIQQGSDNLLDVRAGSTTALVDIQLTNSASVPHWNIPTEAASFSYRAKIIASNDRRGGNYELVTEADGQTKASGDLRLPNTDPEHFIVPFFSKRKIVNYNEHVGESAVFAVSSEMTNLAAKLSRLANPQFPRYLEYTKACESILGFVVTAIPSAGGQRPGIYLPDDSTRIFH